MNFWKKILPLLVCITGELLLLTEARNAFGHFVSPVLHFLFSAGSGVCLLALGWNITKNDFQKVKTPDNTVAFPPGSNRKFRFLILVPIVAYLAITLGKLFAEHPIDMNDPNKSGSDIIPAIMFYVTRFVSGEYPYTPIHGTHWQHTVIPNYFTFQWLPYCMAQLLHIDYRWVPAFFMVLILCYHFFKVEKTPLNLPLKIMLWVLPVAILYLWIRNGKTDFQVTVEGLIVFYYLLFAYSLYAKKIIWIAIPLLLCLLSRYSLVLWTPLLFLILLYDRGFKKTFSLGLLILLGFALFYGPFLLKDPTIFTRGFDYYTIAAGGEWEIHDWQPEGSLYPYQLEQGIGFAIYFFRYGTGDHLQKLEVLRHIHLAVSMGVVLVMCGIYWPRRLKIDPLIFAMASFKIYLAVFYGFIQVPYAYLNAVPLMMTIPVFYTAARCLKALELKKQPDGNNRVQI